MLLDAAGQLRTVIACASCLERSIVIVAPPPPTFRPAPASRKSNRYRKKAKVGTIMNDEERLETLIEGLRRIATARGLRSKEAKAMKQWARLLLKRVGAL